MPLPRVSLRAFLATAKKALRDGEVRAASTSGSSARSYAVVVGNESADLDSLCSAVVLAYLRTYAPRSNKDTNTNTFYIPLSNLQPADLRLRPELVPVLAYAGLGVSELITLADLPFPPSTSTSHSSTGRREGKEVEEQESDKSKWILVDHNHLTGSLDTRYSAQVAGCIDHHDDEGAVPDRATCEAMGEMRVVEKCGSCCSLVVEYSREGWVGMSSAGTKAEESETRNWNAQLARLAIAPVLVDTNNLLDVNKTTERDRAAVVFLEGLLRDTGSEGEGGGGGEAFDAEKYFDEITAAKQDIGGLSLDEILRKDYKQWTEDGGFTLGISSVVKSVEWLVSKAGGEGEEEKEADGGKGVFVGAVWTFMDERALDLGVVMTTYTGNQGAFKRDLFVLGKGEKGVSVARRFEGKCGERLKLGIWEEGGLDSESESYMQGESVEGQGSAQDKTWIRCWDQGEVGCSRKQVGPLMRDAVKE